MSKNYTNRGIKRSKNFLFLSREYVKDETCSLLSPSLYDCYTLICCTSSISVLLSHPLTTIIFFQKVLLISKNSFLSHNLFHTDSEYDYQLLITNITNPLYSPNLQSSLNLVQILCIYIRHNSLNLLYA